VDNYDFDLFVIGAGSGGVRAARWAASKGARVAIAEERHLGGTCVNVGCIPKKLFSYAAHYREDLEDAQGFGWTIGSATFDWATLLENKNREIARLNGVYERFFLGAGVQVVRGRARLAGPTTVAVGGDRYTARYILIAAGGRPIHPAVPGVQHAISSDEAFFLKDLPSSAVIIGGGYIAVEFASIFNGLGVKTTLAYRGKQLLRSFDRDIGIILADEMARKGIDIRLAADVVAIEKIAHGQIVLVTADNQSLDCGLVLNATGRGPNTSDLGLETAGVEVTKDGAIVVNENFESSTPSIYAIGDAINRVQLTPVALAEGMAVAEILFGGPVLEVPYENVPTAVFSHPNVATVGLSEASARQKYRDIRVFKSHFKPLKHNLSGRDERAMVKLVVDADSDRVLGAHMVGADAGEIIQGLAVAINCGVTKSRLDATIGIHPTLAEEFVTMRHEVK
jgi:glutathione reductase (NADPH)